MEATMENPRDCYETYLTRREYTALLHTKFNDPGIRFIVSVYNSVGEDYCRVYPDAAGLVEICNALGHIPWHYHIVVANALRAAGWTESGRDRLTPVAPDRAGGSTGDDESPTRAAGEHDG